MSAICGGVISESMWMEDIEENCGMTYMMCIVLSDEDYKLYCNLVKEGKDKEANKLVKEKGWSVI